MSKIATCLSGHTRTYNKIFPNFSYETDIFISSCLQSGLAPESLPYLSYHYQGYTPTDHIDVQDVLNKYSPKIWSFDDDKHIPQELEKFKDIKTLNGYNIIHMGTMFYRIYQSNKFKKIWEYQNNFKYDYVVRSRFDLTIEEIKFESNKLFIIKDSKYYKDLFFYGPSNIIDQITNCYEWFIYQSPEYLSTFENAEHMFFHYINLLNLDIEEDNEFYFILKKDEPMQVNHFKNGEMWEVYG
jgi:hypothetical protein